MTFRYTTFKNFVHTPRFTVSQFYSQCIHHLCPLGLVAGFRPDMIKFCLMHTLHLGILQWLNGSAIYELIRYNYLGPGPLHQHLHAFTRRLNAWCSMTGIRWGSCKRTHVFTLLEKTFQSLKLLFDNPAFRIPPILEGIPSHTFQLHY